MCVRTCVHEIAQNVLSLSQILDLSDTSHLCNNLNCSEIEKEIWIVFGVFLLFFFFFWFCKWSCDSIKILNQKSYFWEKSKTFWSNLIYIYIYISLMQ